MSDMSDDFREHWSLEILYIKHFHIANDIFSEITIIIKEIFHATNSIKSFLIFTWVIYSSYSFSKKQNDWFARSTSKELCLWFAWFFPVASSWSTSDAPWLAYVFIVGADVLLPNRHQAINNLRVDWVVMIMSHEPSYGMNICIPLIKQTRGGGY